MGTDRVLHVGALNIVLQPHSAKKYRDLINAAHQHSNCIKIRGSDYGVIGSATQEDEKKVSSPFFGYIFKFLDFDPNEPWVDILSKQALDEDDSNTPQIPDHLKPNLRQIPYVFYPAKHRLFFDSKKLGPTTAQSFFDNLFSAQEIVKKFGRVDVNIETSDEAVKRILAMKKKTRLEIHIARPNPDELPNIEKQFYERMEKQSVDDFSEILTSKGKNGIKPDKNTVDLMKVAQSNGKVMAIGRNEEGVRIKESTVQHPMIEPVKYDSATTSLYNALRSGAATILNAITNRL